MKTAQNADVCVVGLGPAGRAIAHRCTAAGLRVVAVDRHPDLGWKPTYGAWRDELPDWLPQTVIAATVMHPTVWTPQRRVVEREYVVLDNDALKSALSLTDVTVVTGRAVRLDRRSVTLADGTELAAAAVIDARGLESGTGDIVAVAHGIFVDAERAEPMVARGECVLVDWRLQNGATQADRPSFLYAIPIGDGTVLFEEVCQGIPGPLSQRELRARVLSRLAANGVALSGQEKSETCHYSLVAPPPKRRGASTRAIPFGARGGMMHPCTGYSVADSLMRTDTLAEALRFGKDPIAALWPLRARAVYWMRLRGLAGLGRLTAEQSAAMVDAFFGATLRQQQALMSKPGDAVGMAAVLVNTVSRTWPFRWRFDLVGWTNRKRWVR